MTLFSIMHKNLLLKIFELYDSSWKTAEQRLRYLNTVIDDTLQKRKDLIELLSNMINPDYQERYSIQQVFQSKFFNNIKPILAKENLPPILPISIEQQSVLKEFLPTILPLLLKDVFFNKLSIEIFYLSIESLYRILGLSKSIQDAKSISNVYATCLWLSYKYIVNMKISAQYYVDFLKKINIDTTIQILESTELYILYQFQGIINLLGFFRLATSIEQLILFYPILIDPEKYKKENFKEWLQKNVYPTNNKMNNLQKFSESVLNLQSQNIKQQMNIQEKSNIQKQQLNKQEKSNIQKQQLNKQQKEQEKDLISKRVSEITVNTGSNTQKKYQRPIIQKISKKR
jgi:hypothetical protein